MLTLNKLVKSLILSRLSEFFDKILHMVIGHFGHKLVKEHHSIAAVNDYDQRQATLEKHDHQWYNGQHGILKTKKTAWLTNTEKPDIISLHYATSNSVYLCATLNKLENVAIIAMYCH